MICITKNWYIIGLRKFNNSLKRRRRYWVDKSVKIHARNVTEAILIAENNNPGWQMVTFWLDWPQ